MKAGEASTAPPAPVMSAVVKTTAPVRVLKLVTPAVPAATAACTNAVVARSVLLVPAMGVGAVGVPVKFGLASKAPPTAEMSEAWKVTAPVRALKLVTGAGTAAMAVVTYAVVAIWVLLVAGAAVGAVGVPLRAGEANKAPPTPVTSAAVSTTAPVLVLKDDTPAAIAAIAAPTNAVVARRVELLPAVCVGAVGLPVKAGDAIGAPPALVTSASVKVTAPVLVLKLDTPVVDAVTAACT